jgi:hypothetical protein
MIKDFIAFQVRRAGLSIHFVEISPLCLSETHLLSHGEKATALVTSCRSSGKDSRSTLSDQLLELIENARIPPALGYLFSHDLERIRGGKRLLIWPLGGQRVKHVDDLQDSGGNRYCLSDQPIGITRTIVFFVMMPDDRKY